MRSERTRSVVTFCSLRLQITAESRSAVLYLQLERTVFTPYLNPRVATKGTSPNVAETFSDNLKQLGRKSIVHFNFAARLHIDLDARHHREPFSVALNCRK